jgi:hypothetical protein
MIWNVLLAVAVLAVLALAWLAHADMSRRKGAKDKYTMLYWESPQITATVVGVLVALFLVVPSLICVGVNSSDVSVYERSGELVELKIGQRDSLAALVQDELSLEQYEAVMAATPDADILVILGNNASMFLVEKTRLLVAINSELNVLVNGLARDRIELCAWADNPLSPRLFLSPVCPDPIQLP